MSEANQNTNQTQQVNQQGTNQQTNQQVNQQTKQTVAGQLLPDEQQLNGTSSNQLGDKKEDETKEIKFEPTGDAGLDLTLSFLGKLGFDIDHPAMVAAGGGDFGLLKAELALLGDKARGWEQVLAVGEAAYLKKDTEFKARQAEDVKKIHEAAGGEEQWKQIKEWAGKNAEPDERTQINAALSQGGMVAQAMAAFLAGQFASATNVTVRGAPAVKDGAGTVTAGNSALSPADYQKGINELKKQYGMHFTNTTEYQELQARRRQWRG